MSQPWIQPRAEVPKAEAEVVAVPQPQQGKSKKTGRFESLRLFQGVGAEGLTASQINVWLWLWGAAKMVDGHNVATLGQSLISKQTGLCLRTVERAIKVLKKKGYLKQIVRGNNIKNQVSSYVLHPLGGAILQLLCWITS